MVLGPVLMIFGYSQVLRHYGDSPAERQRILLGKWTSDDRRVGKVGIVGAVLGGVGAMILFASGYWP